jgi:pimeloyl-ACP methyl ester carboxylesterase
MGYLDRFHYQITGNPQGHKLVFLHGVMGSGGNWVRITPAFEKDFQILRYDQRGHGRSFHPSEGYHPRDFAQDLKVILDELGGESILLVGHSMGGRNALEFAAHFSPRVKALVLEDIGPDSNWEAIERIERLLKLVPTPFATRDEVKRFFENEYPPMISWYPNPQTVAKFLHSNIELKPDGTQDWRFAKSAIFQAMREGRNEDHWDQFRNLKMPTLVVRGEKSTDLTAATWAEMRRVRPQFTYVEIPAAGHWVHFDQPEAFIRALREFFHAVVGTSL